GALADGFHLLWLDDDGPARISHRTCTLVLEALRPCGTAEPFPAERRRLHGERVCDLARSRERIEESYAAAFDGRIVAGCREGEGPARPRLPGHACERARLDGGALARHELVGLRRAAHDLGEAAGAAAVAVDEIAVIALLALAERAIAAYDGEREICVREA